MPIETDALYDLTIPSSIAVSPDGNRVAFVAHEFQNDGETRYKSLFVVPADGSSTPHRVSRLSDVDTPRWRPDGDAIGVLTTREPSVPRRRDGEDAGDGPTRQVWEFDIARGGDPRQVTSLPTGVDDFDWGPIGKRLVVAGADPDADESDGYPKETDRLQYKHLGGWVDDRRTLLHVVDAESGERETLNGTYAAGVMASSTGLAPRWRPDGEEVAFLTNRTDDPDRSRRMNVYRVALRDGTTRRVSDGDVLASTPRWDPTGSRLVYLAGSPENPYRPDEIRLAEAGRTRTVLPDLDYTVRDVRWVDERRLAALVGRDGETVVTLAHVGETATADELVWLDRVGRQAISGRFDAASGTVAACLSATTDPPEVYRLSETADPTRLSEVNGEYLDAEREPVTRRVAVETGDAVVDAQVAFPPGYDPVEGSPLPVVTLIHGGPTTYDSPRFDFETLFWTTREYALLRVNYRGSTSFGREFAEALRGAWNGREVEDVLASVDELVDRGWADPERLFVTGHSQGGIVTAYLLTRTDRFTAAATEGGIYDFRAAFGAGDMHSWYAAEFGTPWEHPEAYDDISSITDVKRIETPTMVLACEFDNRCPTSQAEQLYVGLKRCDVPTRLVVYDESHFLAKPTNVTHRLTTLAEWFEMHAGDD